MSRKRSASNGEGVLASLATQKQQNASSQSSCSKKKFWEDTDSDLEWDKDFLEAARRLELKNNANNFKKTKVSPTVQARTDGGSRQAATCFDKETPLKTDKKKRGRTNTDSDTSIRASFDFSVATYNLWFGGAMDGEPYPGERMTAIAKLLLVREQPLVFIGFQEVIHTLAAALFPLLEQAGYRIFRHYKPSSSVNNDDGTSISDRVSLQRERGYGVAIAVLQCGPDTPTVLDSGWQDFSVTNLERGFLYVRARLPHSDKECIVTTTHMEPYMQSWSGYTGAKQRAPQLREMEAFCNRQMEQREDLQISIMTGDMNFDDESRNPHDEPMQSVLTQSWQDAWLQVHKTAKGYTYDGKLNVMLASGLRRRLDRCLLRAKDTSSFIDAEVIGNEIIPNFGWQKFNPYKKSYSERLLAPSDHFCLVAKIQCTL